MSYGILADLVILIHLGFVSFVVFGGLLVVWRGTVAWAHLPALLWGIAISLMGWVCPLTPLENRLRIASGAAEYEGGFIQHYVVAVLYPAGLNRDIQVGLALLLLVFNLLFYGWALRRRLRH